VDLAPTTFVQFDGDNVRYTINNVAEAKIALKELKLKKKEFGVRKREITAQQKGSVLHTLMRCAAADL
jgi:hypothetical protein